MSQKLVKRGGWVDGQRLPPGFSGQQYSIAGPQIDPMPGRGGQPEEPVVLDGQWAVDRRVQREVGVGDVDAQPGAGRPAQRGDRRAIGDPPASIEDGHPVDGVRGAGDRALR